MLTVSWAAPSEREEESRDCDHKVEHKTSKNTFLYPAISFRSPLWYYGFYIDASMFHAGIHSPLKIKKLYVINRLAQKYPNKIKKKVFRPKRFVKFQFNYFLPKNNIN